jgi:arylsulfatase A-like enzyme
MVKSRMTRRRFLGAVAATGVAAAVTGANVAPRRPNVVFVFADQWRAQATGYAGDPNAHTPALNRFAAEGVNFTHAVSGCPVCSPYRASLITGQYWLTHGVFMNDVHLPDDSPSVGQAFADAGYATGYIGKWHLEGHGRSNRIPESARRGFQYWRVQECTHNYNNSKYFGDGPEALEWDGYDAEAQTCEATNYIKNHADKPFALFLSWGPPHDPYLTAPERFRAQLPPENIQLRANVPQEQVADARRDQAGYYAHIAALDEYFGRIVATITESGIAEDTIVVFTSDHGDMLYSHGMMKKQKPYDESIRVPFLLRYPRLLGKKGSTSEALINAPDIAPTLLGLCGIATPPGMEGKDYADVLQGNKSTNDDYALLACITPFGEWIRTRGGKEYRGIRTRRYTYVRDLSGPWLLYDNENDPYQNQNLANAPEHVDLQKKLDKQLQEALRTRKDEFLPGDEYVKKHGYPVDKTGTVPYAQ